MRGPMTLLTVYIHILESYTLLNVFISHPNLNDELFTCQIVFIATIMLSLGSRFVSLTSLSCETLDCLSKLYPSNKKCIVPSRLRSRGGGGLSHIM